ncbi:transglutaminase domain-containing protein [Exiguobacterium sp.]|uniref:transglutaminase domain-containing protein n=1 Tax=Exiguobacterium sp. TaxID=44751 RepID=UPI00263ADEAB|nr:transglutaminase domain-containing protein [Exiguobacterium sp.]MCC5893820.1 transglutaminase domain-containing protein [Exiguobacterium sp.]
MIEWVKRIAYTALAAYLLSFWVEPIVGSTTFDVMWPFYFLLLVPMFASLLPWYGLIGVVFFNFIAVLYVYHGSLLDWFGIWLEDLSGVLSGELPEEAIFFSAMALIGVLFAILVGRTYPSYGFVLGMIVSTLGLMAYFDTWTLYDGENQIVLAILASLFLLFVTDLAKRPSKSLVRYVSIALLAAVILVLTSVSPTLDGDWSDRITTSFQNAVNEGQSSTGRVGYGVNDEQLGGPFEQDDGIVFIARGVPARYWRIEAKEIYTGKGWVESPVLDSEYNRGQLVDSDVDTTPEQALLRFDRRQTFVPYGGEYPQATETENGTEFRVGNIEETFPNETIHIRPSGKIVFDNENQATPRTIQLRYSVPAFTEAQLNLNEPVTTLTDEEQQAYLQLPDTLPERVRDLAADITADSETPYEQAQAVQAYFRSGDFEYNTEDVATPEGDTDYVDQFLFDTQLGYCDNFSTSAAVLLRANGVPTRWVKGFTMGDARGVIQGQTEHTVRNRHAHSWIEYFVEGAGWVPLEATISFSEANLLQIETESDAGSDPVSNDPQSSTDNEPTNRPQDDIAIDDVAPGELPEQSRNIPVWGWVLIVFGVAFLVWNRKAIERAFMLQWWMRRPLSESSLVGMHRYLVKRLRTAGFKVDGRTPSELAKEVDAYYETEDMTRLTRLFEQTIYADQPPNSKYKEYWKIMIRRIMS